MDKSWCFQQLLSPRRGEVRKDSSRASELTFQGLSIPLGLSGTGTKTELHLGCKILSARGMQVTYSVTFTTFTTSEWQRDEPLQFQVLQRRSSSLLCVAHSRTYHTLLISLALLSEQWAIRKELKTRSYDQHSKYLMVQHVKCRSSSPLTI